MATIYNITIVQGETYISTFPVVDAAGIAIDPTGFTAELDARRSAASSGVPEITLTTASGNGLTFDLVNNALIMRVDPADTTSLAFSGDELELAYDLEITDPADTPARVYKPIRGIMKIIREVTKV